MVHLTPLLSLLLAATAATTAWAVKTPVYLIRHGEKPSDGGNDLSTQGEERAQCLRNVFGASSGYNIGYIMAQDFKSDGSRRRPYDTVLPLSQDLGLTIDHHCDRDDAKCVKDSIKAYTGSGNVLVCWEHDALSDISKELGDEFDYPGDHFDLIYEIVNKQLTDQSPYSEGCPGLDS